LTIDADTAAAGIFAFSVFAFLVALILLWLVVKTYYRVKVIERRLEIERRELEADLDDAPRFARGR